MTKRNYFPGRPQLMLAAVGLALAAPAMALSEIEALTRPDSELTLEIGSVNRDNGQFGRFNGLQERGVEANAEVDLVRLDPVTGTWFIISGRNLGREDREVGFSHQRQGDWRYFGEYNSLVRLSPFEVVGSQTGFGARGTVVNSPGASALHPIELKTERGRSTVGFEKSLGDGLNVQTIFRNETRSGNRMWGSNGQFMVEPLNSETRQADVLLNYTGESLQLTGGFYASTFENDTTRLQMSAVSGAAWAGNAAAGVYALPPSNEAQQMYLQGGYNFSKTARISFKVAQGLATQEDDFIDGVTKLGTNTRNDLGGRIETSLGYVNFTAQPVDKLVLTANVRYEDRDDKTPVIQYIASSSNNSGLNQTYSYQSTRGNLEAKYSLPAGYRLVAGASYDEKTRPLPKFRTVQWRETVEESTYRMELRRSLAESLNGSLGYVMADRGGSQILPDYTAAVVANSNTATTLNWSDRKRDKVRLRLDWSPSDALSVQLTADAARDDYNDTLNGIQKGSGRFFGIDATYAISDDWKASLRASHDESVADQRAISSAVTIPGLPAVASGTPWTARLKNVGDLAGAGVEGKIANKLTVGADYQASNDQGFARIDVTGLGDAFSMEPTSYKQATLSLFANYELSEHLGVRLDYKWDQWKIKDYTWAGWTYADGTTVALDPKQEVQFLGISMSYRYW